MHYISIDAGATKSQAALFDEDKRIHEAEGGPCNPVAYGWEASLNTLLELVRPWLAGLEDFAVLAGIAGAADTRARDFAARELAARLGAVEARVTEDVWPILHANAAGDAAILAISGTGSNVAGQDGRGRWLQAGGRGHVFGDDGSAYALAVAALRALANAEDGLGPATSLQQALVAAADCGTPTGLIAWTGAASKRDIAGLAEAVIREAVAGDSVAAECVETQARLMAAQVNALARRLGLDCTTRIFGHGGLFEHSPLYRSAFCDALAAMPGALRGEGQAPLFQIAAITGPEAVLQLRDAIPLPPWLSLAGAEDKSRPAVPVTERAASGAKLLDEMTSAEIAAAVSEGGMVAAQAVRGAAAELAQLIDATAAAVSEGGRLFYVGAGTSGRLGVLDAAECPPTFGTAPERVQGLIAGGADALVRSIEGAEDDAAAGAEAMRAARVQAGDVVIGIAASGNTPYVAGALEAARAAGAVRALITSNPAATLQAEHRIVLDTGPEILAGSTRMKAGTAAKIALNVISTGAMARAGFVHRGRMIGMRPMNNKLRQRAVAMVAELAECAEGEARAALEATGYLIAAAILVARDGASAEDAMETAAASPNPRAAIAKEDGV